jgi:hypothetical protein
MTVRGLVILGVLFLSASAASRGEDFKVGESVIVVTENADVMVEQKKVGDVPRGTIFKIRQQAPSWLLGEFKIENRTVLGWVSQVSVRRARPDVNETTPHDFNWENLLYATIKLDKDFDFEAHIDDYLIAFRPAVWKQYRNDEFRLAEKRAEALRAFRERVGEFDMNQEFLILTSLTFGKYDFERSVFPIDQANENHYWYEYRYTDTEFPRRIMVFFKNPGLIGQIPMAADAAEEFLAARKSRGGSVDRRVYASIRVRVDSVKSRPGELWSEVRWAQFFSDRGRERLLYETPKPPPAEARKTEESASDVVEVGAGTNE